MFVESAKLLSRLPIRQMLRYGMVGVLSNIAGYAIYLLLTYIGGTPKATMTMLYVVGALVSFFANRRYTFQHDGHIGVAGLRFALMHLTGYLLNFLLLLIFVDKLGFAHQIVQAIAIFIIGFYLFFMFRFFVFSLR